MYLTATFPYFVTTIFLFRSAALEGAMDGLVYMFTPDVSFWDVAVVNDSSFIESFFEQMVLTTL